MAEKKKKHGVPPPKDETKEQRFIRVCTPRVNKTVKMINNIGHCSGAAYAYTSAQVDAIEAALAKAINEMSLSFSKQKRDAAQFKFTPEE